MPLLRWWRRDHRPAEASDPSSALPESEERFRNLVELSPDTILVQGEGVVLYINPAGVTLWGAPDPETLLGTPVLDLVPPKHRERVQKRLARLSRGEPDTSTEQEITRLDGRTLEVESNVVPMTFEGKPAAQLVLRDITERKQRERDLIALKDQLSVDAADMIRLHELSLRLTSNLEMEAVLQEVLAAVLELQSADMGVLRLYDAASEDLLLAASHGFGAEDADAMLHMPLGSGPGGTAARERRRVIVEDVATDPITEGSRERAERSGYKAVYSAPFYARSGDVLGTITTFFREHRQPSEREMRLVDLYAQQAAQFIEHARLFEEAQQAVHARDEMLAIVSHDLRNPVSLVAMCADLLNDETLPQEKRREQVQIIRRTTGRMERLIQDLLDTSVIEAGRLVLARERTGAAELAQEACMLAERLAGRKALRVRCELPEALPEIDVDRDRVMQVFENLLGNAIKFTAEGGQIAVEAEAQGESVRFAVRDSGPGIPEEHRRRIFDRFWQAKHTARTGAGLGLAIARGIVEAHGGRSGSKARWGSEPRSISPCPWQIGSQMRRAPDLQVRGSCVGVPRVSLRSGASHLPELGPQTPPISPRPSARLPRSSPGRG